MWSYMRKCVCVHGNNVNMTSRMRPEKYGRHENSNTSENIALQFTKCTALWSPDLLTDCGPSWVQRGRKTVLCGQKNIVVRRSEPSWLDVKFRASPLNLRTPTNEKHIGLRPGPGDYRMSQKRECAFTITYHILSVHEVCTSSPPMSSLNFIQSP